MRITFTPEGEAAIAQFCPEDTAGMINAVKGTAARFIELSAAANRPTTYTIRDPETHQELVLRPDIHFTIATTETP